MTTTSSDVAKTKGGGRVAVQRFGTFLSGMIMPNLPAFIAWGLITSMFIATGWLGWWEPIAPILGGFGDASVIGWEGARTQLAALEGGGSFTQYVGLVSTMVTFLLPLLIANTGGRMVYGERGAVVASIATMGVIAGTDIPMFLGAMIMGPFAAYVTKQMDRIWEGKIKPGFEMLVNNFSAGILGMLLAILGFFVFGPVIRIVSTALGEVVNWLVSLSLLPVLSIVVEPAKVLFLNNAINHGVFTPLGIQQVEEVGRSILFLIEANPGPGLGILLAFSFSRSRLRLARKNTEARRNDTVAASTTERATPTNPIPGPKLLSGEVATITAMMLPGAAGNFRPLPKMALVATPVMPPAIAAMIVMGLSSTYGK